MMGRNRATIRGQDWQMTQEEWQQFEDYVNSLDDQGLAELHSLQRELAQQDFPDIDFSSQEPQ